jgi:hypothetical protein
MRGCYGDSVAMGILRGLLDRLILVCAVAAGGLVPGFIAQYRQRLGGRLAQAQLDLAGWQRIADQSFHGDLASLIRHHLSSTDPAFHAEGAVIRSLIATVRQLQDALDALHGSVFHQALYLATHIDVGLARATLGEWVPTFSFSVDGLTFAGLFALAVWLLFHASWRTTAAIGGRVHGVLTRRGAPKPM